MVYSKVMKVCLAIAFIAIICSTALFATTNIEQKNDKIQNTVMEILIKVQKYSWPVAVVMLVYALYKYYVVGSEAFEHKVGGQKMIIGLSVFMAIIQCLPLVYAFATIGL